MKKKKKKKKIINVSFQNTAEEWSISFLLNVLLNWEENCINYRLFMGAWLSIFGCNGEQTQSSNKNILQNDKE